MLTGEFFGLLAFLAFLAFWPFWHFGHKYQHCDGTRFSRGIFKFQYWEVASSCPVGMGLLKGCALGHCPSHKNF
jgi:hypothetical protein